MHLRTVLFTNYILFLFLFVNVLDFITIIVPCDGSGHADAGGISGVEVSVSPHAGLLRASVSLGVFAESRALTLYIVMREQLCELCFLR